MMVTPVSESPARIAAATGAAPRCRGKSDAWTLTAPTFQAPDPRERGVKGKLHLILQIEIGSREQRQQVGHIGRKATPQISFDQVFDG